MSVQGTKTISKEFAIERIKLIIQLIEEKDLDTLKEITFEIDALDMNKILESIMCLPFVRESVLFNYAIDS